MLKTIFIFWTWTPNVHTFAIDGVGIAIPDNIHSQPPFITVASCRSFYPANASIVQEIIEIFSLALVFFPFSKKDVIDQCQVAQSSGFVCNSYI